MMIDVILLLSGRILKGCCKSSQSPAEKWTVFLLGLEMDKYVELSSMTPYCILNSFYNYIFK